MTTEATPARKETLYRVAWKHKASGRTGHGNWTPLSLAREWAWAGNSDNSWKVFHVESKPDTK